LKFHLPLQKFRFFFKLWPTNPQTTKKKTWPKEDLAQKKKPLIQLVYSKSTEMGSSYVLNTTQILNITTLCNSSVGHGR